MKTAMQELRDDLVETLKTGDDALNEIKDKSIRESCQKVVQLTLESIIKRIDEELLEMEKEQKIAFAKLHVQKALKAVENEMILSASAVKHWYLPETIK